MSQLRKFLSLFESEEQSRVFYHGTTKEKLPQIMSHGLDPSLSQYADDEKDLEADYDDLPPLATHHFVYLSYTGKFSREWIEDHGDNGVILKITVPPEIADQFIYDRGEFVRSPIVIPPQYISVM